MGILNLSKFKFKNNAQIREALSILVMEAEI